MPAITFTLPPSVLQRLLAEVPEEFRNAFATAALVEALDRHTSSCLPLNKALERPIMSPTIKTKAGRPAPPVRKSKKSLYLDEQVWQALETVSKANGDEGISSAANRLLRKSLLLDGD